MSNIMERLLKEEKEAEELAYGKAEEPTEEKAQSTDDDEELETAPNEESSDEGEDESVDAKESKPQRINWKKRFIGYKSSTDDTIRELRTDNARLRSENEDFRESLSKLNKKVHELQKASEPEKDPFEGVFTQEDEDLLGPEAIAAMKKAALVNRRAESVEDPRVAALEKELREIRQRELAKAKAEAEKSEVNRRDDMRKRLSKAVPNFERIDLDPKFEEWLKDVDDYSGRMRLDLFASAINTFDVAGAARFYNEYAQGTSKKESFLDDHISPTGDGATESDPSDSRGKRMYRISDYEKFMDDVTKGRYRGREKEAKKLEMMYDKAFVESRMYE